VGLHDDAARELAAASASGDLRDELEGALRGAEIRQVERAVGVDDADQRDAREVEALGDHLRADQHVDLAAPEGLERVLVVLAPPHRVRIHAPHARAWEEGRELELDALRARAQRPQPRRSAARARARQRALLAAGVAHHAADAPVPGERDVAARAAHRRAAGLAPQHGREAAPILEQDRLLAALERAAEQVGQTLAEDAAAAARAALDAQVEHLDREAARARSRARAGAGGDVRLVARDASSPSTAWPTRARRSRPRARRGARPRRARGSAACCPA
jgi:hypothetical protein